MPNLVLAVGSVCVVVALLVESVATILVLMWERETDEINRLS